MTRPLRRPGRVRPGARSRADGRSVAAPRAGWTRDTPRDQSARADCTSARPTRVRNRTRAPEGVLVASSSSRRRFRSVLPAAEEVFRSLDAWAGRSVRQPARSSGREIRPRDGLRLLGPKGPSRACGNTTRFPASGSRRSDCSPCRVRNADESASAVAGALAQHGSGARGCTRNIGPRARARSRPSPRRAVLIELATASERPLPPVRPRLLGAGAIATARSPLGRPSRGRSQYTDADASPRIRTSSRGPRAARCREGVPAHVPDARSGASSRTV